MDPRRKPILEMFFDRALRQVGESVPRLLALGQCWGIDFLRGINLMRAAVKLRSTAFSLLVLTEPPHPTRLFFKNRGPRQACLLGWKKRRTSLPRPVQSRSENAVIAAEHRGWASPLQALSCRSAF